MYDSSPLKKFLKTEFAGSTMHRNTEVGIVDMLAGVYKLFNE